MLDFDDEDEYMAGPSGNDWTDPDWYDDEDEDYVDEFLSASTPYVDNTWRYRLREFWWNFKYRLSPNRLRKCPVCHTRNHPHWKEGMCAGCWIPF